MLLFFVRHEALERCRRQELLKTVRVSVLEGGREERKKERGISGAIPTSRQAHWELDDIPAFT